MRAAIVTGAGSGIGRACAVELSRRGLAVVLCGRRDEALRATGSLISGPWAAVVGDVAADETPARLVAAAVDGFGRVDALVLCAAMAPRAGAAATDAGLIRRCVEVNTVAPARLVAAAWGPLARARPGVIVAVSSMAAHDPFPGFLAYGASKAALESMVRSWSIEGRDAGIWAYAVAPGAVETPMLRSLFSAAELPPARCLSAEHVAAVVAGCIEPGAGSPSGGTILVPSP